MSNSPIIEKGVPLPKDGKRGGNKFPFNEMLIGGSFVTENTGARGGYYQNAKRYGIKITIRAEGNKIRVWRIA